MKNEQLHQLLYEALETEMGVVQVYKTAIRCAVKEELKEEWEEYLEQTEKHEQIVLDLLGVIPPSRGGNVKTAIGAARAKQSRQELL